MTARAKCGHEWAHIAVGDDSLTCAKCGAVEHWARVVKILVAQLTESRAKLADMTAQALGHAYASSMAEGGEDIVAQELEYERRSHAETRAELRGVEKELAEAKEDRRRALKRAELDEAYAWATAKAEWIDVATRTLASQSATLQALIAGAPGESGPGARGGTAQRIRGRERHAQEWLAARREGKDRGRWRQSRCRCGARSRTLRNTGPT